MTDLTQLGEFGFIGKIDRLLTAKSASVHQGIGDDCAVYEERGGKRYVASTDALIETVHFKLTTTTPEQLGMKCISVNVSDVAAMGAVPQNALISLGIPRTISYAFLKRFYRGINRACSAYGIQLAGGDTVSSPKHLFINITIFGEGKSKRIFYRSGAKPRDAILTTGFLGDSALGLKILSSPRRAWKLSKADRRYLTERHLNPSARSREGQKLADSSLRVTSMIDISDGLIQDLKHLCVASGTGAMIDSTQLPLSPAFRRVCAANKLNPWELALSGGEDYELLFTLNPLDVKKINQLFDKTHSGVVPIGEMTSLPGALFLKDLEGRPKSVKNLTGYQHF